MLGRFRSSSCWLLCSAASFSKSKTKVRLISGILPKSGSVDLQRKRSESSDYVCLHFLSFVLSSSEWFQSKGQKQRLVHSWRHSRLQNETGPFRCPCNKIGDQDHVLASRAHLHVRLLKWVLVFLWWKLVIPFLYFKLGSQHRPSLLNQGLGCPAKLFWAKRFSQSSFLWQWNNSALIFGAQRCSHCGHQWTARAD